ncbi:hypothetical protein AB0L82_33180 [Nocardia sp. NPDC052001]|uniref:hypothetical protein n=1 Tax=Nocardia sp. NPDC052001 TaxID=3154853 RepID=UPI0034286F02
MSSSKKYPQELRERAVRMFAEIKGEHESEWAAMKACRSASIPLSRNTEQPLACDRHNLGW